MDQDPKAHCNFRKRVGKGAACIIIIIYMLTSIVSLLEDCMTHPLMFISNIGKCNQLNCKAYKESKSGLLL